MYYTKKEAKVDWMISMFDMLFWFVCTINDEYYWVQSTLAFLYYNCLGLSLRGMGRQLVGDRINYILYHYCSSTSTSSLQYLYLLYRGGHEKMDNIGGMSPPNPINTTKQRKYGRILPENGHVAFIPNNQKHFVFWHRRDITFDFSRTVHQHAESIVIWNNKNKILN